MEDCETGILVDLTEPVATSIFSSVSSQEEDKENSNPLTDSIEIGRNADSERRFSLTLKNSEEIQNRILCDVTEQALQSSAKKCASPGLRLIDDETFDFDLAASPSVRCDNVSKDEDDEVFFGPVCFSERLKQCALQEEIVPPLSPLNAEQFALMVKEANYVAYRIKNSKASSGDESSPGVSKQSCSSTEGETTPSSRRHNRSGTFTKCTSPLELLPEEVRKVLPVIDDSKKKIPSVELNNDKSCGKELHTEAEQNTDKAVKSQPTITSSKTMGKTLKAPSKLQGSKLVKPTIKYASSCESLDEKENKTFGNESDSSIASDCNEASQHCQVKNKRIPSAGIPKKSKLLAPAGSHLNRSLNSSMNTSLNSSKSEASRQGSKLSRLALPKSATNTSSKTFTPKYSAPPKSGNSSVSKPSCKADKSSEQTKRCSPRLKAKQDSALPGNTQRSTAPKLITKPSLMKPGDFHTRLQKTVTGNGPLKATQPLGTESIASNKEHEKADVKPVVKTNNPCVSTPVKQDKRVKPKLLANNFATPRNLSSSSTCSTPLSTKRRSFLPTPSKSGSLSSIPGSPLIRRDGSGASSRLSVASSSSSVSDSPVFNNSINRSRLGSTRKTVLQYSNGNEASSPSAMKHGKPRVVHTPQLPQKVQSKWSPIRKQKPISQEEEATRCTKRKL